MRLLTTLVTTLLTTLSGCASSLQKVETVIPVSCVKTVPARPNLPAVPQQGIFSQAQALIVRDRLRQDYEGELEAIVEACR